MHSHLFLVLAMIAIAAQSLLIFLFFFEPYLPYRIRRRPAPSVDSEQFINVLEALAGSQAYHHASVEPLKNGEVYYPAEIEAIRQARHSINIEAYIFQRGRVAKQFIDALTERAKAGVRINIVVDAIGGFATTNRYFKKLIDAGGRVEWYHPFRWYTIPRYNNRTHRELIIIDGHIGFIGGSGVADHWLYPKGKNLRWRDSMYRVEGDVVKGLQSAFTENWLEASGEILVGDIYFPLIESQGGDDISMVVSSAPTAGRSTRARVLYQTLIATARKSICITTPYFLPDKSARKEMAKAVQERGVELKIITPGKHSDHFLTRRSSRRIYGDLLKAGAKIFEYQPSMIHAKCMIIDGTWSIVGTTNFDNRSFGLNDEVNLVVNDQRLASKLTQHFAEDLAESRAVSYEEWRRRSLFERMEELFGWALERQQ